LNFGEEQLEEAFAPMSVTIILEDEIDISRGDVIARRPPINLRGNRILI
jgi:sulfate adenylyltransferase subunit 1